jgi:hypothetical protein
VGGAGSVRVHRAGAAGGSAGGFARWFSRGFASGFAGARAERGFGGVA